MLLCQSLPSIHNMSGFARDSSRVNKTNLNSRQCYTLASPCRPQSTVRHHGLAGDWCKSDFSIVLRHHTARCTRPSPQTHSSHRRLKKSISKYCQLFTKVNNPHGWEEHSSLTRARLGITRLSLLVVPKALRATMSRRGIGANPTSRLFSATTRLAALAPVPKLTPATVDWKKVFPSIVTSSPRSISLMVERNILRLPGQGWELHGWVSLSSPGHCAPPWAGGGLVQVRLLDCSPPPHGLLHSPQSPNPLQPPSTEKKFPALSHLQQGRHPGSEQNRPLTRARMGVARLRLFVIPRALCATMGWRGIGASPTSRLFSSTAILATLAPVSKLSPTTVDWKEVFPSIVTSPSRSISLTFMRKTVLLPGQGCKLHGWVSFSSPGHCAPPWAGGGLVQVRLLDCCPPSHGLLHSPHCPNSLQPPSTEMNGLVQVRIVHKTWDTTGPLTRARLGITRLSLLVVPRALHATMGRRGIGASPTSRLFSATAILATLAPVPKLAPTTVDWKKVFPIIVISSPR